MFIYILLLLYACIYIYISIAYADTYNKKHMLAHVLTVSELGVFTSIIVLLHMGVRALVTLATLTSKDLQMTCVNDIRYTYEICAWLYIYIFYTNIAWSCPNHGTRLKRHWSARITLKELTDTLTVWNKAIILAQDMYNCTLAASSEALEEENNLLMWGALTHHHGHLAHNQRKKNLRSSSI